MHSSGKYKTTLLVITNLVVGALLVLAGGKAVNLTSTDRFCESCHLHPQATMSWKKSIHYDNKGGIVVHCVECHLPPGGIHYLTEKIKTGSRDLYGAWFKDSAKINWKQKSTLEYAIHHTYEATCIDCHKNLFPMGLSKLGENAHLYYEEKPGELNCLNCHLKVGHYSSTAIHEKNVSFGTMAVRTEEEYKEAAVVDSFTSFTETIPGTRIRFDMIAIPGGTFRMGSPEDEEFRQEDEGPVHKVTLSPFFMGKLEVSWAEYMAFFSQTAARGRSTDSKADRLMDKVDAITGPTPPWGDPTQGWGGGNRPVITMTYLAAQTYCRWLSAKTGKNYRLPTEAEWEYACRAGTEGPYFFNANPNKLVGKGIRSLFTGPDTAIINTYVIYKENSQGTTLDPGRSKPNPFGLINMPGSVAEFCLDYYAPEAYSDSSTPACDPRGPASGTEHVIRGGSYIDDAAGVRCGARDYTRTEAWLKTDPQIPKSLWWYSDCKQVGFRVVCEYDEKTGKK
jgi:sulfatase modifying factor 1